MTVSSQPTICDTVTLEVLVHEIQVMITSHLGVLLLNEHYIFYTVHVGIH